MFFGYSDIYSGYYDGGVDRRGWAEKSAAASRRENQAKRMFDDFLANVHKETESFPYEKEVIPPDVHLTQPCYTTFRKYVISKGCKCVRREATPGEISLLPTSSQRNSKMYFVKVTVPTNPAQLLQAKQEAERKAEAAAKKKAIAKRKRQIEQELVERTKREHQSIVDFVSGKATPSNDKENAANQGSPTKKQKTSPPNITVPQARILSHHQSELQVKKTLARAEIAKQRDEEIAKMRAKLTKVFEAKATAEMNSIQAHFDQVKQVIVDATKMAS